MKRILITGENSYIGTSFEKYINQFPDAYSIQTISVRDNSWKATDFSEFDVIIHVAAIVHVKENSVELYDTVNCKLAYNVAEKAKNEGVSQFIFFSSMSVFGIESGNITKDTVPNPKTPYGMSKLKAEKEINKLATENFHVSILRPPMIYGKGCAGNYTRLAKMAAKSPIFPKIDNQRSMLYIYNLTAFIKFIIDANLEGIFFPQNREYVSPGRMVLAIAQAHNKSIKLVKSFNWLISFFMKKNKTFEKVFSSLTYSKDMPGFPEAVFDNLKFDYPTINFEESIQESER